MNAKSQGKGKYKVRVLRVKDIDKFTGPHRPKSNRAEAKQPTPPLSLSTPSPPPLHRNGNLE